MWTPFVALSTPYRQRTVYTPQPVCILLVSPPFPSRQAMVGQWEQHCGPLDTYGQKYTVDTANKTIEIAMITPRAQVSAYTDNNGNASQRKAGVQEPTWQAPVTCMTSAVRHLTAQTLGAAQSGSVTFVSVLPHEIREPNFVCLLPFLYST